MAFQTPLFALALYLMVVQQCAGAPEDLKSADTKYLSFTHGKSGVTCKMDKGISSMNNATKYYKSNGKTVAVEFSGNQLHCCYLEVFDPLPITWRSDLRCTNSIFHLASYTYNNKDGGHAICNPDSPHHCCSKYGWCASSHLHCMDGGVDYALPKYRPVQKSRNNYNGNDDLKVINQKHPCTAPVRNVARP